MPPLLLEALPKVFVCVSLINLKLKKLPSVLLQRQGPYSVASSCIGVAMSHPLAPRSERAFGLWQCTSLVVGNIVGAGIFLLPASLGKYGTLGLFGWAVTCLGSVCLALIFARLGAHFPKIGGPYAYSHEAFGEFVGFQVAWSYWIGTWASNAAIATAFVSYLSVLWPKLNETPTLGFLVASAAVWFFTYLNSVSVRTTGAIQVLIALTKVIPLIVIGFVGIFFVDGANYFPVNPTGGSWLHVVGASAAITLFALLGLETATIPADNVIDPQKTIPRATVLGTVLSAVIYVWTTTVLLGVMPSASLAASNAPFADAARVMFGDWAWQVVAACAAIAAFGTLNGWVMIQGQMPLAAARDRVFPRVFGRISKHGTPVIGMVISSLLMTGLLAMNYQAKLVDQFTAIVTFSTFAMLLPYLYSSVADFLFLLTRKEYVAPKKMARALVISVLGLTYTVIIVAGSGQEAVYYGMLALFSGMPVYAIVKYRERVFTIAHSPLGDDDINELYDANQFPPGQPNPKPHGNGEHAHNEA
jgi:APA family basic amino acid/polyamine antiporter